MSSFSLPTNSFFRLIRVEDAQPLRLLALKTNELTFELFLT